jgi:protein-disulfide isomerase
MEDITLAMHSARIAAFVFLGTLLISDTTFAQRAESTRNLTPAAKVGDDVISLDEVQHAVHGQLAQIERQRHSLINQKLEELVEKRLLAQEAKKRGTNEEQLVKDEIEAKTPEILETEVSDFIEQNRARLPQGAEAELRLKVRDFLRSQRINQRRQAYVQTLRDQFKVAVYLEEPASARVQLNSDKGFARGQKDAPVAIVEFSDYQCPFCKAVRGTVNEIFARYNGKVRWIFRDFPSQRLHPTALKAHEAARCAGDQGKFWEYHDVLFERSPQHSPEELKQYAQELGLSSSAFSDCLESSKYQADVAGDLQEGARMGVSGTPTFFINGRLAEGAMPFAVFQKLIESELARNLAQ